MKNTDISSISCGLGARLVNGYVYGLFNFPVMINSKRKEVVILLLCLLIGFALRYYTFDRKSLWTDEIYTFNDSRDDLKGQLRFYKENATHLQAPLFFILTHLFYPFKNPERDLRIIPLISGILSVPMIYLLAKQFSAGIAIPCTLLLTFMTYHISLSQDARSYSLLMFLGMVGLYFFMKHLQTLRKRYLPLAASFFSILFYTSYSSILFIVLSQILWLYRIDESHRKCNLFAFLLFNGTIFLLCIPWLIFIGLNYNEHPLTTHLFGGLTPASIWTIGYGIVYDWASYAPLMTLSAILLVLFPIFSQHRKNASILLTVLCFPVVGFYLFYRLFHMPHFVTSLYFINFLPLFFISVLLSLQDIEDRFKGMLKSVRLKFLFVTLFAASNLLMLPFYYRAEKQDFRGLANYLKWQIQEGDEIQISTRGHFPGILYYFGVYPIGRQYIIPHSKMSENIYKSKFPLMIEDKSFVVSYSSDSSLRFDLLEKNPNHGRLWLVVNKITAEKLRGTPCIFTGFFDGSFLNYDKFPTDDSMYLYLWAPKSKNKKRN